VITTALCPAAGAELIPASAVAAMRPGSVIVDLAAEAGGNCELTAPGEVVEREGVTIVGLTNLPSSMAVPREPALRRNVVALLHAPGPGGELALDFDDEITAGACVTRKRGAAERGLLARPAGPAGTKSARFARSGTDTAPIAGIVSREGGGTSPTLGWGGCGRPSARARRVSHGTLLVFELTILVLAIFLGFEVISKVPTLLHTPLMSGTNAIHGIVIVGAMIVLAQPHKDTLRLDRRLRRGRARVGQRRRRLRRHRPDARDVQEARARRRSTPPRRQGPER
jgi:NAD(P) transhydrogenase subunit alpha